MRLPVIAEFVLGWFFGEGLVEEGAKGRFIGEWAQGGLEGDFAVVAEAGAEMAVRGKADLVARFAEVKIGERADEADDGACFLQAVIFGGTVAHFFLEGDEGVLR